MAAALRGNALPNWENNLESRIPGCGKNVSFRQSQPDALLTRSISKLSMQRLFFGELHIVAICRNFSVRAEKAAMLRTCRVGHTSMQYVAVSVHWGSFLRVPLVQEHPGPTVLFWGLCRVPDGWKLTRGLVSELLRFEPLRQDFKSCGPRALTARLHLQAMKDHGNMRILHPGAKAQE